MANVLSRLKKSKAARVEDRTPAAQRDSAVAADALRNTDLRLSATKANSPQPTAYRTAPDPLEPKWMQARRKNHQRCHFLRLPYELRLCIFQHLDFLALFALRQTCSGFLHAMESDDVKNIVGGPQAYYRQYGENVQGPRQTYFVFANSEGWRFYESNQSVNVTCHLRQLDEQMCLGCRLSYKDDEIRYLLTHRPREFLWCRGCAKHHDFMMFSERQRTRSPIEWTCIGREGAVPLCQQKSISWEDVSSLAAQQTEGTEMTSAFALSCRNPEHILGKCTRTWCKVSAGDLVGSFNLDVVWIQAAFDLDPAVPVTREHIRRFLLAQASTQFGAAFCPHVKPNDGRLLLPFEPSVCVCFVDGANNDAAAAVMGSEHTHDNGRPCCRCAAQRRPGRQTEQAVFFSAEDGGFDEQTWDQDTRHAYTCSQCEACYTWVHEWGGSRVYLRCHRRMRCQTAPDSKRWLTHIHPASWRAADDSNKTRKRLFLCNTPGCQTQARWINLMPRADWGPYWNLERTNIPLHLLAMRDTQVREAAAREGVSWVEKNLAVEVIKHRDRYKGPPVVCENMRKFVAAVALAAASQPSPGMLDVVRRMEAAFAMANVPLPLQPAPDDANGVLKEAPVSWAAKTKRETESVANMAGWYRVYPDLVNPLAGRIADRYRTAFFRLEAEEGRSVWHLQHGGDQSSAVLIYHTCKDMFTEWRNAPAATPEVEQARKAADDAATRACASPNFGTLHALREARARARAMAEQ